MIYGRAEKFTRHDSVLNFFLFLIFWKILMEPAADKAKPPLNGVGKSTCDKFGGHVVGNRLKNVCLKIKSYINRDM